MRFSAIEHRARSLYWRADVCGTKAGLRRSLHLCRRGHLARELAVGCSHPGIDKIVEAAATINPKIHLIAGGFHLVVASSSAPAGRIAAMNCDIFAANVKAKNVDLTNLDFVVLSHRHGDHMAGLAHVLSVNPNVKIYAPKDGFGGVFGGHTVVQTLVPWSLQNIRLRGS